MNGLGGVARRVRDATTGESLRAQLLRGGIGSIAVKTAHAALAFTLAVVLARILGPEGYGIYSFALAVLMLSAIPAQVGIPHLVIRETAKAETNEDWGLMRGLWRWANWAVVAFSALALLIVGAVLLLPNLTDSPRASTVAIGIGLIPLIALANVRAACLRGLRKVVQGQLPESVVRPALLLVFVFLAAHLVPHDNGFAPGHAMMAYIAAAALAFIVGAYLLWRARPEPLRQAPTPAFQTTDWAKAVIPLAMITGLQLVNNYADLIILGIFWSDDDVGIYRVVSQTALLASFAFHLLGKVIQPHLAALYNKGDISRLQSLVSVSIRIVLLFGVAVSLGFLIFGEPILSYIFGEAYSAGFLALVILSIGKLLYSTMGIAWHVLNMSGHQMATFKVSIFASLSNIALNLALIPQFGMEGAALATTISFGIFFICIHRAVRQLTGIRVGPNLRP